MEQVQQLIEILKSTPEMALWGLGLFFGWTLLKLASVVSAITMIAKLAIDKTHNYMYKNADFKNQEQLRYSMRKESEINIEKQKIENESLEMRKNYFVQFLNDLSINKEVHESHWRKVVRKIHDIKQDNHLEYKYMHKNHMEFLLEVLTQLESGDIKLKNKNSD